MPMFAPRSGRGVFSTLGTTMDVPSPKYKMPSSPNFTSEAVFVNTTILILTVLDVQFDLSAIMYPQRRWEANRRWPQGNASKHNNRIFFMTNLSDIKSIQFS